MRILSYDPVTGDIVNVYETFDLIPENMQPYVQKALDGKVYTAFGCFWQYANGTPNAPQVAKCDPLTGEVLEMVAIASLSPVARSNVRKCCQGKRKTAIGFAWRFS